MATYIRKQTADILRQALMKLESNSEVKAVSPGSIARAFTEAITTEIGDFYDALDFHTTQTVISSASGHALDMLGDLYGVQRKTLTTLAATEKQVGAFYFYIDAVHGSNITIPKGTAIYTRVDTYVGRQLGYETTEDVTIFAGQKRAFASIVPRIADAPFTAAAGSLTVHDFASPAGVLVRSTNPKAISPQPGYEDDDNYRLRIIKSIRVAAGGTLEAVRFSVLSIPGVRDVKIKDVPYGLGSMEIIVVSESGSFSNRALSEITDSVNRVRPIGVRTFVRQADLTAVDVSATLIIRSTFSTQEAEAISRRANTIVKRYLNSLLPGDVLVYNRLISHIMDSTEGILDVKITRFAPNGNEVLRRNYTPEEDEQLIPGRIEISVSS